MMSLEKAQKLFDYDKETGHLLWKFQKARRTKVGKPAGAIYPGKCINLIIDYCPYKAHHIVWLLNKGEWPKEEIDHIDGNPINNRIENLRLATRKQNSFNVSIHKDNLSGFKGVSRSRDKWLARIQGRHIGLFLTAEEASAAYEAEAKKTFGEFYRVRG
jgi:hypothetical protein